MDGVKTPHYDDVIGMRLIDLVGVGQFMLADPSISNNGVKEIKSCTAYSLEYELTYKQISMDESTYLFYDPTNPADTVMGIIMEYCPSWSVGTVSTNLLNKYRTFDVSGDNIYNFIKGTLQSKFRCIFDFDTYERKINVISVDDIIGTRPVYMSLQNLLKDIKIDEDTENVFTCLDVYGADDVDIRSVNPMGTNKIYDISYIIESGNLPDSFVNKWNSWKSAFDGYQDLFYQLVIDQSMQTSGVLAQQAALTKLNGEMTGLEAIKASYVSAIAQGLTQDVSGSYFSDLLAQVNLDIASKQSEIDAVNAQISAGNTEASDIELELESIRAMCSFENFFDDYVCPYCGGEAHKTGNVYLCEECGSVSDKAESELHVLDRCLKETSLEDTSFVADTVNSYQPLTADGTISNLPITVSGSFISSSSGSDKTRYTISGGTLLMSGTNAIAARIVNASMVVTTATNAFLFTAYLGTGTVGTEAYSRGSFTASGTLSSISGDLEVTSDVGGSNYQEGTYLQFTPSTAGVYFTTDTSEYALTSVSWDLYQYARDCMRKLSYPAYTFTVNSGNFMAMDVFDSFRKNLKLGQKVYLDLDQGRVLEPICTGITYSFDNPGNMELQFSDTYSGADYALNLVDLLEESVSMGKRVSRQSGGWNAFVDSNASSTVKEFIDSALDVTKNRILSSSGQAVSWDESGLRLRKWADQDHTLYEPEQIWMTDRNIVFTDDDWNTAKMALGMIQLPDGSAGYGLVADYILGNLVASKNMVVSNDAGTMRIDGNGITVSGMSFRIVNSDNVDDADSKTMIDTLSRIDGTLGEHTIVVYYLPEIPEDISEGDLWYVTEDVLGSDDAVLYAKGEVYKYQDDILAPITDSSIVNGLASAGSAEAISDGKISTYYSRTVPSASDIGVGDIWRNMSTTGPSGYEPGKMYVYNGTEWAVVEDDSISSLVDFIGDNILEDFTIHDGANIYLDASKIAGAINSTMTRMSACNDNMVYDSTGMWLMNNTSKQLASKIVWMNNEGILLGASRKSSSDTTDPTYRNGTVMDWRTAITADGIKADYLVGDHMHATFDISAGPASGSSYETCPFYVDGDTGKLYANGADIDGTVDADRLLLGGKDITSLFKPVTNSSSEVNGLDLGSITIQNGVITFHDRNIYNWDGSRNYNANSIASMQLTGSSAIGSSYAFDVRSHTLGYGQDSGLRLTSGGGSVYIQGGSGGYQETLPAASVPYILLDVDGGVKLHGASLTFNGQAVGSGGGTGGVAVFG